VEITIATPALLFSTVSLLMIAFTNRFLAIANLIRGLHDKFKENPTDKINIQQIKNLQKRLKIIRNIQLISISSLLASAVSMFLLLWQQQEFSKFLFGFALILQIVALMMSVFEITLSMNALKIELSDMDLEEKS
jgi:cell division protein FtsL